MGLSKFFLNTGEALRPVLTKIIPMKLLSKMKAGIINNATDKLSADSIEKYEAGRYKCGANIIGNIKGDNGLGQSARIMCRLLDENKEPHVIRDFFVPPGGSRSNDTYDDRLTEELPFDVNIIHVNASEFMVAYLSLGKEVWDYRYNIGSRCNKEASENLYPKHSFFGQGSRVAHCIGRNDGRDYRNGRKPPCISPFQCLPDLS